MPPSNRIGFGRNAAPSMARVLPLIRRSGVDDHLRLGRAAEHGQQCWRDKCAVDAKAFEHFSSGRIGRLIARHIGFLRGVLRWSLFQLLAHEHLQVARLLTRKGLYRRALYTAIRVIGMTVELRYVLLGGRQPSREPADRQG